MTKLHLVDPLDEDKDRNFITALARGLDVLRCYRPNETLLSNQDIATRTGLPKATVSRLTHTLCRLDYLSLEPKSGAYRLGAGVLSLGFSVLCTMDIGERAKSQMCALRDGPNSYITCALAERHLTDVIYIAVERSREDVALTMHIGSRLPLFFSAIGRAVLVGLPEDERQAAFEIGAKLDPDNTNNHHASYAQAKREFETLGYTTGYGDWRADVNGIAVPMISPTDGRVYGLNVGGPSFHVKKKQLEQIYAPLLQNAVAALGSPLK